MRKNISKKLVFIAEYILNPSSYRFLFNEEVLKTADSKPGAGRFNFAAFDVKGNVVIDKITASLSVNNSQVGKQIQPITSLSLFSHTSQTLSFLKTIEESKLDETQFRFNGNRVIDYDALSSKEFESSDKSRIPENLISFDSDLNRDLIYFPQPVKGGKSIVDNLNLLYNFSFQDYFQGSPMIEIPPATKLVMVFPNVSLPIPPSRFRASMGTIAVGIQLNIGYEEI